MLGILQIKYAVILQNPGNTLNVTNSTMENEELFAGDPDVAPMSTRETRTEDMNENTPLIDEADGLLYRQHSHLTDDRPKWRRASVSDYWGCDKCSRNNCLTYKRDRFGGCSHLGSFLPWALVEWLCPRSI